MFLVEGIALAGVFALNTYGWEDDVADLPIKYIFAYVSGSANASDTASEMVVRAALESSEATDVYLPQVRVPSWRIRCAPSGRTRRVVLRMLGHVKRPQHSVTCHVYLERSRTTQRRAQQQLRLILPLNPVCIGQDAYPMRCTCTSPLAATEERAGQVVA